LSAVECELLTRAGLPTLRAIRTSRNSSKLRRTRSEFLSPRPNAKWTTPLLLTLGTTKSPEAQNRTMKSSLRIYPLVCTKSAYNTSISSLGACPPMQSQSTIEKPN